MSGAGIERPKRGKLLWTLFHSMLAISAFTFGGGFVIVPLMKKRFVDKLKWLEEDEMLDMTAIAQASPGAIAVNASILVGRRLAGAAGIAAAVLLAAGTVEVRITDWFVFKDEADLKYIGLKNYEEILLHQL